MSYGSAPTPLGTFDYGWDEFMHYLYLPVVMPSSFPKMPANVQFLEDTVFKVMANFQTVTGRRARDQYVYLSARRGFATPGNPLNRPGWHCDDFGGQDLNYIWSDRYPTRFLQLDSTGVELDIPADDQESMTAFAWLAANAGKSYPELDIKTYPDKTLLRLDPYVIHDTPIIPAPGGMRSFFKISISQHRYNLKGNSHNYLFDYDWVMHDRAELRNQPNGNGDYVKDDR